MFGGAIIFSRRRHRLELRFSHLTEGKKNNGSSSITFKKKNLMLSFFREKENRFSQRCYFEVSFLDGEFPFWIGSIHRVIFQGAMDSDGGPNDKHSSQRSPTATHTYEHERCLLVDVVVEHVAEALELGPEHGQWEAEDSEDEL